jgi:purine nucleosidase
LIKIPILLDTDPGNDIDDALAISYLLKKPECEFLGITTVTGPVQKRAAIAQVLCDAHGRSDIPIICGRSEVLAYGQGQPWCAQYDPIAHLPHNLDRKQNEAVDFLRQTIRSRPGEITLLSIGPFSNIALLFALDPEIPFLLKEFVSMAGVFRRPDIEAEWNCICDPVASSIVANSRRPKHTWFGLDVTLQCQMSKTECQEKFHGPLLELVMTMATKWFDHSPNITFHDPLAAASIFRLDLCDFETGSVNVNPERGQTTFDAGEGTDDIAVTVNANEFFEEFFRIVNEHSH